MSDTPFKIGDRVMVKDPSNYISEWKAKFTNRIGLVERVGPDSWKNCAFIRFQKRNGRGEEFVRWMDFRRIVPAPDGQEQKQAKKKAPKQALTIDEQVEVINKRMFRRRLDQWNPTHEGWRKEEPHRDCRPTIREHLLAGHRVTSGYYPTSVRGFHRYIVLWKPRQ